MACNPTRLELSNAATTTVQITLATDPGDGTAVTLQVDELGIDHSSSTSGGVALFTIAAVSASNNSIWDATIQVGANRPATAEVVVTETNTAQTVGLTISDSSVTYCAPSVATLTTYPLVLGTSVTANTSTNSTVTFDEYWSGSPTLYGQQQWKKRNFGSYFRNIDTNGFSSSTTYDGSTIVWSSADPAVIEDLSQADFEGHIDLLFANWLTHCINAVNSQVSTYPDDYQSRMYIVADMEFAAVDENFAQNFSKVRLRIKDGTTYDATATPHSVYFGDGTADSPKSINAKGLYFLNKLEAWVDAMEAEFAWAAGRIMWYNLPQSLVANQLQAASGSSSTAAEAQAYYTDWLSRYDEITSFPVTQFESLVDRMGPHAPLYPPTYAVKPEYLIGYVQAIGAIGGTVMMDGNLQPNQAGSATLWDTWNSYTADDFTMSGYYQPTTASTRWRMPHGVIQYLQTKAVQAGANIQHFMAYEHDVLFFDDSVTDATLLAAINLAWPTLDLSDTDAGTPGSDSSGDRWGRIRRSEMIYNNHQFDDYTATSLNDINDVDVPSPANGQVLGWNSTSERWEATTVSGSGTVTSVGLNVPGGFTVSGTNPITTSGTFEITSSLSGVIKGDGAATFSGDAELNDLADVNIATGAGNDGNLVYYDHAAGAGAKFKGAARSSIALSEFNNDLTLGANDYIAQPTYTNNQVKLWHDFLNAVPDRMSPPPVWWMNSGGSGVLPEESTVVGSRGAVELPLNANSDRYTFWGPSVLTGPQEADGDEILWEARCYFDDSSSTEGGMFFGIVDQLPGLGWNSFPPGPGYSNFDQVGISIRLSQTYIQWFVKDTGVAGSPTVTDLTSYPQSSYVDTWFRFGIHAKYNALNVNWDIELFVNGSSVATTTMTFDSIMIPYVGATVGTYDQPCSVHIDWISCQYKIGGLVSGRTTHVSIEDL